MRCYNFKLNRCYFINEIWSWHQNTRNSITITLDEINWKNKKIQLTLSRCFDLNCTMTNPRWRFTTMDLLPSMWNSIWSAVGSSSISSIRLCIRGMLKRNISNWVEFIVTPSEVGCKAMFPLSSVYYNIQTQFVLTSQT